MTKDSLKILTKNAMWLAVDKPYGISVHNKEDSVNLLDLLKRQLPGNQFFPVHRLDKETTGIQIIAIDPEAATDLAEQFQTHKVQKFYQGVVAGQLPDEGTWSEPLTDKAEGWKNPAGLKPERVPCETRYHKIRQTQYFTWLEFELLTGRQHQIRKHCAIAGRALIGDPRYGNPKYNQKIAQIYGFNRMALHCTKIILQDGSTIESKVPREFDNLFKA